MNKDLKILLLEDNPYDAKLNVYQLRKDKIQFEYRLTDNRDSFISALAEYNPDLILSDYSLPQFTGLNALAIVQKQYPEIPFIMVTGSLDEETAVNCMKQGAWDYVIKDHIVRLGPAVKNAIERRNEILKKKETEKLLLESERKFRDFVLLLPEVIFETDLEGKIIYVNETAFKLFQMTAADVADGLNIMDVVAPEDLPRARKNLELVINGEETRSDEYLLKKINGEIFPAMVHLSMTVKDQVPCGFSGVLVDITERKINEQNLLKSLQEKEVLLREVHHRVKNNMQIISSMLKMQVRQIKNEEAKAHLTDSHHRVRSMAMIHEKLYQTKDLEIINFKEYIHSLAASIFSAYHRDSHQIEMKIDVEEVMLNINTAIPCGLILNELITNALKHAFPNKRGTLTIKMTQSATSQINLNVCDDGIGIPAGIEFGKIKTLGLQLITALVQQLGGSMEFIRGNGTCFKMEFKQE